MKLGHRVTLHLPKSGDFDRVIMIGVKEGGELEKDIGTVIEVHEKKPELAPLLEASMLALDDPNYATLTALEVAVVILRTETCDDCGKLAQVDELALCVDCNSSRSEQSEQDRRETVDASADHRLQMMKEAGRI